MRATQHPSNNRVLGAPAGWEQGELPCSALAVTDTEVGGAAAIASFWVPSPEELKLLNEGGTVALFVIGYGMPPVALSVEPPR